MTALSSKVKIMIHTYSSLAMSVPTINFLQSMVSEILPGQNSKGQGYYSKIKGQIKVTPCHCKPITPKECPYQVSTSYTLQLSRHSSDRTL